ncbi:MAG: B12-binding domain-containing protein, partial [Thermoanaerobaculia bacterium]|nr:B12-binding domain-containing protein [Thermoanaerobaculia bacterium]
MTDLRVRYLAALIDCDQVAASSAVGQGLSAGLDPATLLLEILSPVQLEMGELWHRGEVTIAQEHWGTETTRRQVER